jgi:hypothetical protein
LSRTTTRKPRFQVGDRVLVAFGRPTVAKVVEDRGCLGRDGARLYSVLIEFDEDEGEDIILEVPEEELEIHTGPEPTLDAPKIIDYFKRGGLAAILRSNRFHGLTRPQAWLRLTRGGYVVHTYAPGPGFRGGQPIPFHAASRGGRILEPFKDEVVSYIESFGLDRSQAEDVLSAVGTAPSRGRTSAVPTEKSQP